MLALPDKQLIFGIGLPKTGTSSLTNALYILGYPCIHDVKRVEAVRKANIAEGKHSLAGLTEEYDAFCDSPIPWIFKELDDEYPGSKFIYTVRDLPDWLVSRIAHFGGQPKFHRDKLVRHMFEVNERFKDRPNDILTYNLCGGAGWEPLCQFLDVKVPKEPFPHKNITKEERRLLVERRFYRR